MLGLQLTFWEHATTFTGETFDLLLFAIITWQLLEYRMDEKEWRLMVAALIYGAGITESWMFIAFFPVFLAAIIWLKKLEFFNLRLLVRLVLCGLAGLLFFFLLPLTTKFNSHFQLGIWEALKPNIRMDWSMIKSVQEADVRIQLLQACLGTVLPLLLIEANPLEFRLSATTAASARRLAGKHDSFCSCGGHFWRLCLG